LINILCPQGGMRLGFAALRVLSRPTFAAQAEAAAPGLRVSH
jgi:hypothetical protein